MPGGPRRNQSTVGRRNATGGVGNSTSIHKTTVSDHSGMGRKKHNNDNETTSLIHPARYHPLNATHDVEKCPVPTVSHDLRTLLAHRPTFRVPIRSSRYAFREKSTSVNPDITLIELKRSDEPGFKTMEYVLTVLCCNYSEETRKHWLCMFDIDNTLAVNGKEGGAVYAILPLCWLLQHLMRAGFPVVLFTARTHSKDVIEFTKHSLERMGIPWDELQGLYFLPSHVDVDSNLSTVAQWKHSIREELVLDQPLTNGSSSSHTSIHPNEYHGCAFAVGDNWFDLFPYASTASLGSLDEAFPSTHVLARYLHPTGEDDRSPVNLLQHQHKRPTRAKHTKGDYKEYASEAYASSVPKIMLKLPHDVLDESFYNRVRLYADGT